LKKPPKKNLPETTLFQKRKKELLREKRKRENKEWEKTISMDKKKSVSLKAGGKTKHLIVSCTYLLTEEIFTKLFSTLTAAFNCGAAFFKKKEVGGGKGSDPQNANHSREKEQYERKNTTQK